MAIPENSFVDPFALIPGIKRGFLAQPKLHDFLSGGVPGGDRSNRDPGIDQNTERGGGKFQKLASLLKLFGLRTRFDQRELAPFPGLGIRIANQAHAGV